MSTPYKGERGEMEKSVVACFDDISHLRNIQKHLWLHESTAMQMKFPNKSQPSHEEVGGEVANGDVQKHHHHDWLMWGGTHTKSVTVTSATRQN